MIARLRGIVEMLDAEGAVLDVGGVGYLLSCSARTLARLEPVGSEKVVQVETVMREDRIQLFGFADTAERDWFRLLTTVQGVGPRVALAILSALPPRDLTTAIAAGDSVAVARANGVGPKLAARVVAVLKDKALGLGAGLAPAPKGRGKAAAAAPGDEGPDLLGDATSALVNLGYGRTEAFAAAGRAAATLGAGAALSAVITAALKDLSA